MAKPSHEPAPNPFPSDEEIAERAYELCFVLRDSLEEPQNYVDVAEDELLDRAARRALVPLDRADAPVDEPLVLHGVYIRVLDSSPIEWRPPGSTALPPRGRPQDPLPISTTLPVHEPRAELARVQPARARPGARRSPSAARAREVPRHRRRRTSTSSSWCASRRCSRSCAPASSDVSLGRHDGFPATRRPSGSGRRRMMQRPGRLLGAIAAARARASRHPVSRARRLLGPTRRLPARRTSGRNLSAADAAGLRSGPSRFR